jgi:hypothetical protein
LPTPARGVLGIGRFLCIGLLAVTAAYGVESLLGIHGPVDAFFDTWVYNGLLVAASLACLARAFVVKAERLPWLLLGIALALWTVGDLYYFFAFSGAARCRSRRCPTRSISRSIR